MAIEQLREMANTDIYKLLNNKKLWEKLVHLVEERTKKVIAERIYEKEFKRERFENGLC